MSFVYSKKRSLGGKRKIRSRTRRNRKKDGGMDTGLKDHRGNTIYVPIKPDGEYAIEGDVGKTPIPDVAQLRGVGPTPTMDEIQDVFANKGGRKKTKRSRRKTKRSRRKSRKSKRKSKRRTKK
jgi:hypothetical protein